MKKEYTQRGFEVINFSDYYKQKCSLQKSSIAEPECIWLGVDNTGEKITGANGKFNCE